MADKILKSITFPNLPDKYIIPETTVDSAPTQGSAKAVSSGGVWDALRDTDDTLTQARQAADAEVTGKIAKALFDVTDEVSPVFLELGSINTSTGADSSSNDGTRLRSNYIKVPENQTVYELKNGTSSAITVYIVYYDANKGFLQAKTATGADAGESLIGGISTVTNAVYIRFRFAGTGMSTSNVDLSVKLSAGGTMHSYPAITSGLDMDTDFNKSGTWLVTSAKNIPANYPSTTTGKIVVFGANNATTVGRLQFVFDKNGNIFQRQSFVNGTWSTWKSVITSFELNDFKSKTAYDYGNVTTAGLDLNTGDFLQSGVWTVANVAYLPKHCPTSVACRIFSLSSSTSSALFTFQRIVDNDGKIFTRFAYNSTKWTNWEKESTLHSDIAFTPIFTQQIPFTCETQIAKDTGATGRVSRLYGLYDAETSQDISIDKSSLGNDASNTYPVNIYKVSLAKNATEKPIVLVIVGEHGDELNSAMSGYYTYKEVIGGCLKKYLSFVDFWFVPLMNPYGYENELRNNGNDVNLNRDFPCEWAYSTVQKNKTGNYALSQVETQYIYNLLLNNKDKILFLCNKHDTNYIGAKIESQFDGIVGYASTIMVSDKEVNNGLCAYQSSQLLITDPWIVDDYTGSADLSKMRLIASQNLVTPGSLDVFANSIGIHGSLLEVAYTAGVSAYGASHNEDLARLSVDFLCNWISACIENNAKMLSSDALSTYVTYYTKIDDSGTYVDAEQYWNGEQLLTV